MKWIRIDESDSMLRSHLTKKDKRLLMNMVMKYGWNCWHLGDQMFPWEDAERDDYRRKIEDMLDGMTYV